MTSRHLPNDISLRVVFLFEECYSIQNTFFCSKIAKSKKSAKLYDCFVCATPCFFVSAVTPQYYPGPSLFMGKWNNISLSFMTQQITIHFLNCRPYYCFPIQSMLASSTNILQVPTTYSEGYYLLL